MNMYTLAVIGSVIPEVLKFLDGKYNSDLPSHLKSINFWISLALQIGLGVFTVYLLQEKVGDNKIMATACGFGGTAILSKILTIAVKLLGSDQKMNIESDQSNGVMWYMS